MNNRTRHVDNGDYCKRVKNKIKLFSPIVDFLNYIIPFCLYTKETGKMTLKTCYTFILNPSYRSFDIPIINNQIEKIDIQGRKLMLQRIIIQQNKKT